MSVEVQNIPVTNGHAAGSTVEDGVNGVPKPTGPKFASGLILPPPELKSVIERIAVAVARSSNPLQFEDRLRESQRSDPKFSFLNSADPYHGYYRHQMEKIANGEVEDVAGAGTPGGKEVTKLEVDKLVEQVDLGLEFQPPEFMLDLPNISAIDLDIMKLTALFTARRGRNFLASLSAREGRNYQFDFLRPTHSLFGHFNRLVEQYTKVLLPSREMLGNLEASSMEGARWKTLEVAKRHAIWEKRVREREKKREDDREAEHIAFAEIDWHDYAIVQTIEFTAADANSELPPPMSVQEVESMTLAQKRMAAMIMEDTAEDVETHRARQAAAEAEAAAAVGGVGIVDEGDAVMEQSDDEDDDVKARRLREDEERAREVERARAVQANSLDAGGPMKIRTDYVPKFGAKNTKAMTTCIVCGQQVPVDELDEHMRIELLDPRWKSQRDALEARKAQASELQRGANVVSSLKTLARTRVDIFGAEADEERRKKEEEEERERRKEREKVVWDGHTASKANTLDKFSSNVNFDEQIAAIHRAKGLGPQDAAAIGPGIGPAVAPPPLTSLPPAPASLPAPPHQAGSSATDPAYSGATISAGPQPASMYSNQPAPVLLPTLHYQGLDAAQPFGYQPPPPPIPAAASMHPARLAALAMSPPQAQIGQVRTADEMEGVGGDEMPPAKKQRLSILRLPGGQLYPEEDWVNMHPHPISLKVQLPNDPSKPEWKLDGTIVTLPELLLTLLVSTLRDRILQHTGSTVAASRIRLSFAGKMLTNANSIASYNLEDEDLLVLSVSNPKRR